MGLLSDQSGQACFGLLVGKLHEHGELERVSVQESSSLLQHETEIVRAMDIRVCMRVVVERGDDGSLATGRPGRQTGLHERNEGGP